jgi:hypothetical protein
MAPKNKRARYDATRVGMKENVSDDDDDDESNNDDDDDDGGFPNRTGNPPPQGGSFVTASEIHEKLCAPNEECVLCKFGFRPQRIQGVNPTWDDLWDLYQRNKDTQSDEESAKTIARYYEKNVWRPLTERGEECPLLTFKQILKHLRFHIRDPEAATAIAFGKLNEMTHEMFDTILVRQGSSTFIHEKHTKSLAQLLKVQLDYARALKKSG